MPLRPCAACSAPTVTRVELTAYGAAAREEGVPEGTVLGVWPICAPCRALRAQTVADQQRLLAELTKLGCPVLAATDVVLKRTLLS